MKQTYITSLMFASLMLISTTSFAGTNSNSSSTSSASTNSSSTSSNGGMTNNQTFVTQNPDGVTYHGKYKVENVPSVMLGAFGNSLSSDYCDGTVQGTFAVAGMGAGFGHEKLDKGCQLLRAADMTMRISNTYFQDYYNALKMAQAQGPSKSSQAFATKELNYAYSKIIESDKLKSAAINMVCQISDQIRKAYEAVGIKCLGN